MKSFICVIAFLAFSCICQAGTDLQSNDFGGNQTPPATLSQSPSMGQPSANRQPSFDDILNMVQKKTGVDFAKDPYEVADAKVAAEQTDAFKRVFPGYTIKDLPNMTRDQKKHWEMVLHKVQTQYRADAKEKQANAYKLLETYLQFYNVTGSQ